MTKEQLISQARELFPPKASVGVTFYPANDHGCMSALSGEGSDFNDDEKHIAVTIGHSYIGATLARMLELGGTDTLFICDNDAHLIEIVEFEIECLRQAQDRGELLRLYCSHSHPAVKKEQSDPLKTLRNYIERYETHLDKETPWLSDDVFHKNKAAALRVTLVPICINLFDADSVKQLADFIHSHEQRITFINLTNLGMEVWDKEHKIPALLASLPIHAPCYFMGSYKFFSFTSSHSQNDLRYRYTSELHLLSTDDYIQTIYRREMVCQLYLNFKDGEHAKWMRENPLQRFPLNETVGTTGYTLVELTGLYADGNPSNLFDPSFLRDLLLIGGKVTPRLFFEFMKISQQEYIKYPHANAPIQFNARDNEALKQLLKDEFKKYCIDVACSTTRTLTKAQYPQGIFIRWVGHNATIITYGDTYIDRLASGSNVVVHDGNLYVSSCDSGSHLETRKTHSDSQSSIFINQVSKGDHRSDFLRAISAGSLAIEKCPPITIDAVCANNIFLAEEIGWGGFLMCHGSLQFSHKCRRTEFPIYHLSGDQEGSFINDTDSTPVERQFFLILLLARLAIIHETKWPLPQVNGLTIDGLALSLIKLILSDSDIDAIVEPSQPSKTASLSLANTYGIVPDEWVTRIEKITNEIYVYFAKIKSKRLSAFFQPMIRDELPTASENPASMPLESSSTVAHAKPTSQNSG